MNIGTIGKGLVGLYGTSIFSETYLINKKSPEVRLNDTDVKIHICTLDEEDTIKRTLKSLMQQEKVKDGSIDLVLVDSDSDDNTKEIARPFVDKIINTPRGKLTSRDIALRNSDADIIAYADAGDFYPKDWLNKLLSPFSEKDVVGVGGFSHTISKLNKPVGLMNNFNILMNTVLLGRNSALRKNAYIECGGFNLNIDETDLKEVWFEEEFKFPDRLEEVGKVKIKPSASCYYIDRRTPIIGNGSEKFNEQVESDKRF